MTRRTPMTGLEATRLWQEVQREMTRAAADCIKRLELLRPRLSHLSPNEEQAWREARRACDRLYILTNKSEPEP